MDEPLSNLDARPRLQMRAELKRLHQRLPATIIYLTHDQAEAMTLSDRVVERGNDPGVGRPAWLQGLHRGPILEERAHPAGLTARDADRLRRCPGVASQETRRDRGGGERTAHRGRLEPASLECTPGPSPRWMSSSHPTTTAASRHRALSFANGERGGHDDGAAMDHGLRVRVVVLKRVKQRAIQKGRRGRGS